MLRGAILGVGNVARHGHLPGWARRADVEIVAAADPHPARRAAMAEFVPRVRRYASAAALLEAETLDFVDVCAPPSSHAPLVLAALERGLHVLCEKPLVATRSELAAVRGTAAAAGRVVFTVHNWHAAPIVRRTAGLLASGAVGHVTAVVWETLRVRPAAAAGGEAANWRIDPAIGGGGVLTDHGWHTFYVLLRWIGAAPVAVSATLERRRHPGLVVEDTASLQLAFPSAKADVFLTWAADRRDNRVEVRGTEGTLHLLDDTLVWRSHAGAEQRWPCPPPLSHGSAHREWFDDVAAEFVAAVRGAESAEANATEAACCAAIESAARESSRQGGRAVRLEPWP